MTVVAWTLTARFDTQEQAKQAAAVLVKMAPSSYRFTASNRDDLIVWAERGDEYGAHDVRL